MPELAQVGQKLAELWEVYKGLLPDFGLAFLLALLLTPLMAVLATRIGAIDLPAHLRKRTEAGLERNVNARVHPRLGGLGMALGLLLSLTLLGHLGSVSWGIIVGVLIIVCYGILDDVKDLKFKHQLLGQLAAATVVVLAGVTIPNIQIAGIFMNFDLFHATFSVGNFVYNLVFPADLITILWIVAMINFVNWMSGMDGLNHLVTAVASFMILLIAINNGNFPVAILIAAHLGANLGAAVFNYPPAYIFPGAIGEHLNGFLLAVFAILSGGKLPLAITTMAIPLIDALWVMTNRFRKGYMQNKSVSEGLSAMTKPDTNHLHHRLMAIGLSWKSILTVEVGITVALSAVAFYLSGFRNDFVALVASMSAILIIIGSVYAFSRYRENKRQFEKFINPQEEAEAKVEVVYKTDSDEEKYVY